MSDFSIKSGSTGPAFTVRLMDGDQFLDLTGATVTFRMRPVEGGLYAVNEQPAVIVGSPLDGRVSYEWQVGDTAVAGLYDAEFVVTFLSGTPQVFPKDGYLSVEVEQSLVSVVPEAMPDMPDSCWPVDPAACTDLDEYSGSIQQRAKALAGATLRSLTAYSVGGCPITIRPRAKSQACGHAHYNFGWMTPANWGGTWVNCACPSATPANVIALPPPVGAIESVLIDGVALATTEYEVMDGHYLVRTDGTAWPTTQDPTLPSTQPGTFAITYLRGQPVDGMGAHAAGILACEFAKALSSRKCRLPENVTSIVRQGVSMTLVSGMFPDGVTGIREVDAFIRLYNPHALKQQVAIVSPDQPRMWTT